MSASLKEGDCPQCGSERVYSGEFLDNKEGLRAGNRLSIDETFSVAIDNYVCVDCGYCEAYINERGALNRIGRVWRKVPVQKQDESN